MRNRAAIIGTALTAAAATVLAVALISNGDSGYQAAAGSASVGRQSQNNPAISLLAAGASKTCVYTATHTGHKVSLPSPSVNTDVRYTAVLRTNLGNIVIGLNSRAPCTVNSFVHLAEVGFFSNTQCQRLVTAGIYILQCGDPYATARTKLTCSLNSLNGAPGYRFASENLKGATYPAGTVAMASVNIDNGSQFFIVYKDSTSSLLPVYTPFGTVSSGLNIVRNVAKDGYSCQYIDSGVSEGGAPKEKVIINSVTITRARPSAQPGDGLN